MIAIDDFLQAKRVDCDALGRALNTLDDAGRQAATRRLSRQGMQRLFEAVAGYRDLTLEALVPEALPLKPVEHVGTNNLPMSRAFSKVMYRQPTGELAGRNVQRFEWLTGPGYFTLALKPGVVSEVLVDYSHLPTATKPGWPDVTDNRRGMSYFVYRDLQDVLRSVSEHVSIGRAFRRGKALPNYFILTRAAKPS